MFFYFTGNVQAEEYCAYENFHPSCSKNEVIVITSAIYGRMKEGRCLELDKKKAADKQDPQYFGCSVDVLKFMDGKCSGKPACNVRVNDQELLRQESSCYKDLMKYLESVHLCVPGNYSTHSQLEIRNYVLPSYAKVDPILNQFLNVQ